MCPLGFMSNSDLLKKGVLRKFIERLLAKLGISAVMSVTAQTIDRREMKDETAEALQRSEQTVRETVGR